MQKPWSPASSSFSPVGSPYLSGGEEDLDLSASQPQPPSCALKDSTGRFSEGHLIGQGAFGVTVRVRDKRHDNREVIVKLQSKTERHEEYNEVRVHHAILSALLGRDRAADPDLGRDAQVCNVPLLLGFSRCDIGIDQVSRIMNPGQVSLLKSAAQNVKDLATASSIQIIESEFVRGSPLGDVLLYGPKKPAQQYPAKKKPGYSLVRSFDEFASFWTQLMCTLSYLQKTTSFRHADLHGGNIMIETIALEDRGRPLRYRLPIVDVLGRVTDWVFYARPLLRVKIIDFGLSRVDTKDSPARHSYLYTESLQIRKPSYYQFRADMTHIASYMLFYWGHAWSERPPQSKEETKVALDIMRILVHAVGRTPVSANSARRPELLVAAAELVVTRPDAPRWKELCLRVASEGLAVFEESAACARIAAGADRKKTRGCDRWESYNQDPPTQLARLRGPINYDEHLVLFAGELNGWHERAAALEPSGQRPLQAWIQYDPKKRGEVKGDFTALDMFPGAGEALSFREARNRKVKPALFLYEKTARFVELFSSQMLAYDEYRRLAEQMKWTDHGYAKPLLEENLSLYDQAVAEWKNESSGGDGGKKNKKTEETKEEEKATPSDAPAPPPSKKSVPSTIPAEHHLSAPSDEHYGCSVCGRRAQYRAGHEGFSCELPFCSEHCTRRFCEMFH